MKITLNSTYAVYSWHWDVKDDELCGICRVAFEGTCPTCKYPGDQCPIVIGECHHAFHLHCIWKWLETETSRGLCPMCRQPFHIDKDLPVNQGINLPASGGDILPQPTGLGVSTSEDGIEIYNDDSGSRSTTTIDMNGG